MLEARGIVLERRGRRLLDGIDLAIPAGRVTAIIGPNGAGKSMLLKVLAGELKPSIGSIVLDDRDLRTFSAAALSRRRAMVPQATSLSFPFTVIEVVRLGASVPGFDSIETPAHRIADRALQAVDLESFRTRLYSELSGGEKQRVHIARALCQLDAAHRKPGEAAILILDEPTSSLDLAHQIRVLDEARRQAETGRAVLVVLHDLNLAAAWADDIVLMSSGRILARGSPVVVFNDELLSAAYGCEIRVNRAPPQGVPYMLPQLLTTSPPGSIAINNPY
ncbi:heme ABC transporter ATP-binding protein [Hyphomicrobium sp. CS1GBMeth3]|uniref:heme ABC transporter ATP-binding protein n=1 Tax=Hyphomicrobium sp. CS1GBMeth3 TaxID=1892845 RepID=UPI000931F398|nr:heme ABC transporter ATP-binding protein [Hyphomicrobium sp. CS1GBMeth3]